MTHAYQLLLSCLLLSSSTGLIQAQTQPAPDGNGVIILDVDASHIPRKIISARERIPASPGPLTLVYPQWIPGNHGPTGPITDLVNMHFLANGQPLPWQRDGVDMYAFHVTVPEGAAEIEADFASVGEFAQDADFNLGNTSTAVQGDLNWDQIVLYPSGTKSDDLKVKATVTLPANWSYATALPDAIQKGDRLRFGTVSLTTLVDSPVMMGSIAKQFDVTPPGETRKHTLNVFGETPGDLALGDDRVAGFRNLVAETGALFGARHYRDYHFLVEAHGDANNGLEHHQSSDNQVPELGMVTPSFNAEGGYLLAHEMTHSWNGKYRRPAGLATSNYQQPMVGDLLWVYEGLTSYFGEVLAVRAGLDTISDFRDRLGARDQSVLAYTTGRDWRPLQDTATAAQLLYLASPHWEALRRSTDYYIEGPLLWLEVDSIMRQQSHGSKSIDDFARAFYGPPSLAPGMEPSVVPYTFDDVVKALNAVVPYDWAALLRKRLDALRPAPPSPGLEAAGWHVVYTDVQSQVDKDAEANTDSIDLRPSVGLLLDLNGEIIDVAPDSAAGKAGLAPEWKIVAINRRVYTSDGLKSAIVAAKTNRKPITLMILHDNYFSDFAVDYTEGLRYPHLERVPDKPDLLEAIAKPRRK
ncbi:MAG: M61 family metallopeptidase [Acidobacteriaceae bacterium]